MATTTANTILRQAPFIEEQQRRLLGLAEGVSNRNITLPRQKVAGFDPLTNAAFATGRGIGQYQPMVNTAQGTVGTGLGTLQDLSAGVGQQFTAGAGTASRAIQGLQDTGLGASEQRFDQAGQALSGASGQYAAGPSYDAQQFQGGPGYDAQHFQGGPGYAAQGYDPSSVSEYFNPYEDAAVQQALSDISRQGDIAQNQLSAQAVGAGAFGGSRQGLQSAELGRNVLEQQGRTASGMRQAGFQAAMQQSMAGFEEQQRRAQAESQFGAQVGQQAFEDQQRRAQAQAQFGTQVGQQAFEDQQRRAQAQDQFGTQVGQQAFEDQQRRAQAESQFGTQVGQQSFEDQQRRAQTESQFGTQTGQQAFEQARQRQLALGQGLGSLGGQQAGAQAQYAQTLGGLGSGLAGIGAGQAQEAARLGLGIGSLGTTQANIASAGQNMLGQQSQIQSALGALGQTQAQRGLDATYQGDLRQAYEPYQRYNWMSDIIKPTIGSSSSTLAATTAPNPSGLSQLIGGGIGMLGVNKAIGNPLGGLFGGGS